MNDRHPTPPQTPRRHRRTRVAALLAALPLAACGGGDADGPALPAAGDPAAADPAPAAVTPGYAVGDPDAAVVIQEYADFQCPFCARHYVENHERIEAILEDEGARFEHFEIGAPGHGQALDATVAARFAGEQDAYAEARHAIYTNQDAWSGSLEADAILRALVLPFAADTAALDDCLAGQRLTVGRILNRNLRAAMARGVRSTPTTIVSHGGRERLLAGVVSAEAIAEAIASLREGTEGAGAGPDDGG